MQGNRYSEPASVKYDLSPEQCGDKLAVSQTLVVISCPRTKRLTIFRRSNMEILSEKIFTGDAIYGANIQLLNREEGKLTYVFYSIEPN